MHTLLILRIPMSMSTKVIVYCCSHERGSTKKLKNPSFVPICKHTGKIEWVH